MQVSKTITTNLFLPDETTGKLKLFYTCSQMGFSNEKYRVAKFLRENDEGNYENVELPYVIGTDGSFSAFSDEVFNGKALFVSDT